jgi:hypothetical protein
MIYILLTALLFALNFKFQSNSYKSNVQVYYFVWFVLFLFSAFRYEVGCDWISYKYIIEDISYLDTWEVINRRDPLFWALLDSVNKFNLPYAFINIFSSAIFFVGVHILARRQPNPIGFLVVLFPILIMNMPMSGIRQGAAIGIMCIAIVAIIDKRPIHFLLWVFLATGFHVSAFAFIALMPFASGKYDQKRILAAALLVLLALFFLYFTGSAKVAQNAYIGTRRESYGAIYRIGMLTLTGLYFLLFVKKKWQRTFPQDFNIVNVGVIGMMVMMFIVPISTIISDRYGYYFIICQAMIFARLPYLRFENKSNQALYCILPYLGLFIVFTVWVYSSWHFAPCYLPYKSLIFNLFGDFVTKYPDDVF